MAGFTVRISKNTIDSALNKLSGQLSNLEPVFRDVGEYMLRATRSRFDGQVDPEGNGWVPLKPATVKAKQKRQRGKGRTKSGRLIAKSKANPTDILLDTFALRDTITYEATGDRVSIGSPLIKARSLQLGNPESGLPPRPFLGLSAANEQEIVEILEDHLAIK